MLEAPQVKLAASVIMAFETAWTTRDVTRLPPDLSRWLFLRWLEGQGVLFHGSQQAGLTAFEPRPPMDLSSDEFSKRPGVFASSDGLWALMYALRDRHRVARMVNTAVQLREGSGWSSSRYFVSLAPQVGTVTDPRALLSAGVVYVLARNGFEPMPAYDWPGLGRVREPQWVKPEAAFPLLAVPVSPADFPLPVRTHDAAVIDARAATDPWGFPWLDT